MTQLGQYATLEVVKIVDFGFYLDAGELGEILLPKRQIKEPPQVGDEVEVFIYLDSKDLPIATTKRPRAKVGDFAHLTVKDVGRFGAFLDWGLEKDLLVPFGEQHRPLEVGDTCIVYVYVDDIDHRITASSKIDKYLEEDGTDKFKANEEVSLLIANNTDLGLKAIINNSHWGLIYKDDIFGQISFGQRKKGFIKQVRSDGKINISFNGGKVTRDKNAHVIMNYLSKNEGYAPFHDKTDPKLISRAFGISKAAFKKAIGGLYKNKEIVIEKNGIRLVEK